MCYSFCHSRVRKERTGYNVLDALPERRTRSYSQLADYLHCGWAYRLKKVKRVEETPSVWLPGGTAFHAATEEFDIETFELDLSALEIDGYISKARDSFVNHFERAVEEMTEKHPDTTKWRTAGRATKEKPNGEDLDWWHEAGQEMVTNYIRWRINTNDTWAIATVEGRPAVEVEIKAPLGQTPLRHYVDRLLRDRNTNALCVMDLKSGSRMPSTPLQLATYSVLLEQMLGEPVLWGAFYDARRGYLTEPMDLSRFTPANLGVLYDTLDEAATRGLYLPKLDTHCVKCGVREFCVWQGGVEPPDPTPSK